MQTLYEFLTSRRTRAVTPASLEPIALLFVQLSVELRKGFTLKDGLHQFKKNIQVSDNGLPIFENVARNLIEVATKRLETAQSEADLNTDDDDLDDSQSPEDILLSAVSSEQSKDRSDRELVTPWLRFLWESYRLVLDLLRNNSNLEVTYSEVVQKAYQFCLKYNRKTEFRKLSELLRNHIASATQQRPGQKPQYNSVDLHDPETLQRHLELRFNQLNVSVKLELWQEAFRSVEDLHSLITSSKRPPKPGMMVSYYENLTKIFLVSDNELFHAASWQKFFNLYSQSPNATEEQLVRYSSIFFLSTLAIPQESFNLDLSEDYVKHSKHRLASLLNLPKAPTRESLIQFGSTKNVYNYVHPLIKKLYQLLEVNFHPLTIRDELNAIIPELEANSAFAQYVKPLTKVVLTKLFEQISQVYESVKLDYLIQLATFNSKFELSPLEIESFLLNAGRDGQLSFFIDHDAGVVNFVSDPFEAVTPNTSDLQSSPSDLVRAQLSNLAKALYASTQYTDPTYAQRQQSLREKLIASATQALAKEREEAEKTRELLEQRKAELEREEREREAEALKERQRKLEEEKAAEANRATEEARRRLEEKIKRDKEAIEFAEKKKLVEEINANGVIKLDVNKLRDLSTREIQDLQVEQLQKDQVDLESRVKTLFKKLDHTERAYRKYELPLLEKDSSLQKDRDVKAHEEFKAKKIATAKKAHAEALELIHRLEKFVPEFVKFKSEIDGAAAAKREALLKVQREKLEAAKKERIEQIRQERYEQALAEFRAAKEREAAEEERRKAEEENAAKEAKRAEDLKRLREERESANQELDAKAARQREIDAMIEAKLNKGSSSVPTPSPSASPAASPAAPAAPAAQAEAPKKPLTYAEKLRLKRQQNR